MYIFFYGSYYHQLKSQIMTSFEPSFFQLFKKSETEKVITLFSHSLYSVFIIFLIFTHIVIIFSLIGKSNFLCWARFF